MHAMTRNVPPHTPQCSMSIWTKAPALATERHQLLVPAGIAFDAQESVFEAPALQVRLELFDDEVGERGTFGIKAF